MKRSWPIELFSFAHPRLALAADLFLCQQVAVMEKQHEITSVDAGGHVVVAPGPGYGYEGMEKIRLDDEKAAFNNDSIQVLPASEEKAVKQ